MKKTPKTKVVAKATKQSTTNVSTKKVATKSPKVEKKVAEKVIVKKVAAAKPTVVKKTVTKVNATAPKVEKKAVVKVAAKKVVVAKPIVKKKAEVKTAVNKVAKVATKATIKNAAPRVARTSTNIPTVRLNFVLSGEAAKAAKEVKLMGDFNSWDPAKAVNMKKQKDGSFQSLLALEKGRRYEYRFLIDGKKWLSDENASETVPTPFGEQNSVVLA
jgi:hypothetical protein